MKYMQHLAVTSLAALACGAVLAQDKDQRDGDYECVIEARQQLDVRSSAEGVIEAVLVRRGDVVRTGQTVARVGSTGLSTGPHLHYGVYVHGQDVDPAAWKEMPPWLQPGADSARMAARRGG